MNILRSLFPRKPRRARPIRDAIDATANDLAGMAGTVDWLLSSVPKCHMETRLTAMTNAERSANELALKIAELVRRERERLLDATEEAAG